MITIKQFACNHGLTRQRINVLILAGRVKPPPLKLGNLYIFAGNEKIINVKLGRPFLKKNLRNKST